MLLAKLYLNAAVYMGTPNYAGALAAAQRVIGSGAYAIDPNYRRMFLADNNTSPELIVVVPQDGARTQSFGGTTFLVHAAIGNALNDSASTSFGVNGGWYGLRVKPEFVSLFGSGASAAADRRSGILYGRGQTLSIASLTEPGRGRLDAQRAWRRPGLHDGRAQPVEQAPARAAVALVAARVAVADA